MKRKSTVQAGYLHELQLIAGKPQEQWGLSRFGENIKIWVWNRKPRNTLLVLADRARDLDLKVYVMKRYKVNKNYKFEVVDPSGSLEEVNMVTIWCPDI